MTRPKISVVTATRNAGGTIARAVESVLAQDYEPFEHIIFDAVSTDRTLEVLARYPHLRVTSEPDRGQSHALNKGLRQVDGDIVVVLNADDYFEPGAFAAVAEALAADPGTDMVLGKCFVVDEHDEHIRSLELARPCVSYPEILNWWQHPYPLNPVSYFYRSDVHDRVGYFNEANRYSMDYEFLIGVAKACRVTFVDAWLGSFAFHEGTTSFDSIKDGSAFTDLRRYEAFWKELPWRDRWALRLSYARYEGRRRYRGLRRSLEGRVAGRSRVPS